MEDVRRLHGVLQSLNVGMKMPQNALKYEQVEMIQRYFFFVTDKEVK
jgi:hypothetical protein